MIEPSPLCLPISRADRITAERIRREICRQQDEAAISHVALPPADGIGPIGLADGITYRILESASRSALEKHYAHRIQVGEGDRAIDERLLAQIIRAAVKSAVRGGVQRDELVSEIIAQEHRTQRFGAAENALWRPDPLADNTLRISENIAKSFDLHVDRAEQMYLHHTADGAFEASHLDGRAFRLYRRQTTDPKVQAFVELRTFAPRCDEQRFDSAWLSHPLGKQTLSVLTLIKIAGRPPQDAAATAAARFAAEHCEHPETRAHALLELVTRDTENAERYAAEACAIATHPATRALAHLRSAECAIARGDHGTAIQHYKDSAEYAIDPDARAHALLQLATFDAAHARSYWERIIRSACDSQTRAQTHLRLGGLEEDDAVEHYEAAIHHSNNPETHARAHLAIGRRCDANDENDSALHRFEMATELSRNPNTEAEAYLHLGLRGSDPDSAARDIGDALRIAKRPDLRAKIHLAMGQRNMTDALSHLESAIALDPQSDTAATARIELARRNDFEQNQQ